MLKWQMFPRLLKAVSGGCTPTARWIQLPVVDISNKVPGKGCLDKQRRGPIMRGPHLSDISVLLSFILSFMHSKVLQNMHSFSFFAQPSKGNVHVGINKNERRQTYIQTLEQVIINHSRAERVNSSDTDGSAASAAHAAPLRLSPAPNFALILSHSWPWHILSAQGLQSISQSSVQLIDFLTPRYHSDSSSTKALCPFQIIRSKSLPSWDKVPPICPVPPSPFLLSVSLSPFGKTKYFAVFTAFWAQKRAQQMTMLRELTSECIIPVQRAGSDQYVWYDCPQMKARGGWRPWPEPLMHPMKFSVITSLFLVLFFLSFVPKISSSVSKRCKKDMINSIWF